MSDKNRQDAPSAYQERQHRQAVNRWLESQRGRRAYRAAPRADKAMARIMRPLTRQFGAGSTGLRAHWAEIVGPRFAALSTPMRFQGHKAGRTLIISAPGPAAALIMASSHTIIERANAYLGPGYIQRIKLVQTRIKEQHLTGHTQQHVSPELSPSEMLNLQSTLEKVQDPDVKAALEKLGKTIMGSKRD